MRRLQCVRMGQLRLPHWHFHAPAGTFGRGRCCCSQPGLGALQRRMLHEVRAAQFVLPHLAQSQLPSGCSRYMFPGGGVIFACDCCGGACFIS